MEFSVGSRAIEIKFDYATMYKVNRDLGSQGPDGSRNEDGVGALFLPRCGSQRFGSSGSYQAMRFIKSGKP